MAEASQDPIQFTPTPGYCLLDPIQKDTKSNYMTVHDAVDQPHKATVLAVGKPKVTDFGAVIESPVKVGDFVLFSISGCERFKMEYKNDPRYGLVIAPFGRVLGVINGK